MEDYFLGSRGPYGKHVHQYTSTCVTLAVCSTLTMDEVQKSLVQLCVCEDNTLVYASSVKLSALAFLWR